MRSDRGQLTPMNVTNLQSLTDGDDKTDDQNDNLEVEKFKFVLFSQPNSSPHIHTKRLRDINMGKSR